MQANTFTTDSSFILSNGGSFPTVAPDSNMTGGPGGARSAGAAPSASPAAPDGDRPSWMPDDHRNRVCRRLLQQHLADQGFVQLLRGTKRTAPAVIVHRVRNVSREVDDRYIRQHLLTEASTLGYSSTVLNTICDLKKGDIDAMTRMLPASSHNGRVPDTAALTTFTDTRDEGRHILSDGVVVITANTIAAHPVEALDL